MLALRLELRSIEGMRMRGQSAFSGVSDRIRYIVRPHKTEGRREVRCRRWMTGFCCPMGRHPACTESWYSANQGSRGGLAGLTSNKGSDDARSKDHPRLTLSSKASNEIPFSLATTIARRPSDNRMP